MVKCKFYTNRLAYYGYHSSRYFTKLFKSITGLTPSEYKKSLKI
ncbi:AraC family transcriptional regulator [Clostridium sp.]